MDSSGPFEDNFCICQKFVKRLGDEVLHNENQQALVVINSNVHEGHHAFQRCGPVGINPVASRQQFRNVAGSVRHAKSLTAHQVLAHVQNGFAGALHVAVWLCLGE